MEKNRLEAFSDGVLAIIITIMILELKQPVSDGWGDFLALCPKTIFCTPRFTISHIAQHK